MTELDDRVLRHDPRAHAVAARTPRSRSATCDAGPAPIEPLRARAARPRAALAAAPRRGRCAPTRPRACRTRRRAGRRGAPSSTAPRQAVAARLDALRRDLTRCSPADAAWSTTRPTSRAACSPVDDSIDRLRRRCSRGPRASALPQTGWGFALRRGNGAAVRGSARPVARAGRDRWDDRLDRVRRAARRVRRAARRRHRRRAVRAACGGPSAPSRPPPTVPPPATPRRLPLLALLARRRPPSRPRGTASRLLATTGDTCCRRCSPRARPAAARRDFDLDAVHLDRGRGRSVIASSRPGSSRPRRRGRERRLGERAATRHRCDDASGRRADARGARSTQAAKALLGEDFVRRPGVQLSRAAGRASVANALAASRERRSARPPRPALGVDFPVDDWLHGLARVREQRARLGAGRDARGALRPPRAGADADAAAVHAGRPLARRWSSRRTPRSTPTACSTPPTSPPAFDHGRAPVRPAARRVDRGDARRARRPPASTFHYDRPNTEPPQTMLLVTPAGSAAPGSGTTSSTRSTRRWTWRKRRAVEPAHLDATPYAPLPAGHGRRDHAVSQLTIAADLALNNDVADRSWRTDDG